VSKRSVELEELKFEIQKCDFERDELYQMLDFYIYDNWDYRLDVELPILQSKHEMRMMAMKMMTNSINDAMERYKELIQVNSSQHIRHSQLLREQTQLKNDIKSLLNEKRELLVEQNDCQHPMWRQRGSVKRSERTSVSPVRSNSSPAESQTWHRPGQDLPWREVLQEEY
uniref:Disks large homolog 5 N-terminal domain-containing protein n=1 Tax=Rattus norvegicus TaxID=10116 RepID=M0R400_RAT